MTPIRSAVRQAIAWMVRDGLTPPTVGNADPSQIHRLGMSQLRQSAFTTLNAGSSPIRQVPFRWQVSSVCSQMSRASTACSEWAMKSKACRINALSLPQNE
jgi:hypothetical protein